MHYVVVVRHDREDNGYDWFWKPFESVFQPCVGMEIAASEWYGEEEVIAVGVNSHGVGVAYLTPADAASAKMYRNESGWRPSTPWDITPADLMPIRLPILKQQEFPLDDPDSNNMFQPGPEKPLVATPGAVDLYGQEVVLACWRLLQMKAEEHDGLDYLQVFESGTDNQEDLWFIEDAAITALLPSDY